VDEIRAGGTLEAGDLARRLGTSPQLVEAMLGHLQRSGHIRNYVKCDDACGGCGIRDLCNKSSLNAPRLWQGGTEE
jgi:hypothetical protein